MTRYKVYADGQVFTVEAPTAQAAAWTFCQKRGVPSEIMTVANDAGSWLFSATLNPEIGGYDLEMVE